jgi:hypothetical protein
VSPVALRPWVAADNARIGQQIYAPPFDTTIYRLSCPFGGERVSVSAGNRLLVLGFVVA